MSDLVGNPGDRFSRVTAHMVFIRHLTLFQVVQQDTEAYMLIFGGKEKQGTNFGIKPLPVWKCKLKKV